MDIWFPFVLCAFRPTARQVEVDEVGPDRLEVSLGGSSAPLALHVPGGMDASAIRVKVRAPLMAGCMSPSEGGRSSRDGPGPELPAASAPPFPPS